MLFNVCVASDIQKKIENLRTYFGKECGKENEWKPKSGSAHKTPFKSSWPWYTELTWLKDHIGCKESTSNLSMGMAVKVEDDVDSPQQAPTRKRGRGNSGEERLIKAAEDMVAKFPAFGGPPTAKPSSTDDELFGQLVARKMSKLPENEEKEDLKLNIQLLIKQAMYNSGKKPCSGSLFNLK